MFPAQRRQVLQQRAIDTLTVIAQGVRRPFHIGGRKPKMTESKIESAKKLLSSGVPAKDVAKNIGVSVPTLYRWVPASAQP